MIILFFFFLYNLFIIFLFIIFFLKSFSWILLRFSLSSCSIKISMMIVNWVIMEFTNKNILNLYNIYPLLLNYAYLSSCLFLASLTSAYVISVYLSSAHIVSGLNLSLPPSGHILSDTSLFVLPLFNKIT